MANVNRNGVNTGMMFVANVKALFKEEGDNKKWYEFYGLYMEVNDRKETEDILPAGHRAATGVSYGKESVDITLQGKATFGEMMFFLGTGVAQTPPAPAKFTMFYGDNTGGWLYTGCTVTGWSLTQDENGVNLSVNLTGGKGVWQTDTPTKNGDDDISYCPMGNVLIRGREIARGDTYGSYVKSRKGGTGNYGEEGDWYSWGIEVSNLTQNVYWGYAITPSAAGSGTLDASFSLNWDATQENTNDSLNYYEPIEWEVDNKTQYKSENYEFNIFFKSMIVESQGYADEQEIVRSFQSSHKIIDAGYTTQGNSEKRIIAIEYKYPTSNNG